MNIKLKPYLEFPLNVVISSLLFFPDTMPTEEKKSVIKEDSKAVNKKANEDEKSLFEVITYVIALFLVCSYGGYLYDKSAFEQYPMLQPLVTFFEKVEQFSPFMEFLEDDNWATESQAKKSNPKVSFSLHFHFFGSTFCLSKLVPC